MHRLTKGQINARKKRRARSKRVRQYVKLALMKGAYYAAATATNTAHQ